MTSDAAGRIAALETLHRTLRSGPPSALTIARVVDLSHAALPGDATKAVIDRLQESSSPMVAIELVEAAIASLRSGAAHELMRPDGASQLQGFVTQAIFDNKLVRRLVIGLFLAYALAASLLLLPIRDAFGTASKAADILHEAQKTVGATDERLEEAKNLVAQVTSRINDTRASFDLVQQQIGQIKEEVKGIADELAKRKGDFERHVAEIEAAIAGQAEAARMRIGEAPARADAEAKKAFAEAEKLAKGRLSAVGTSIDGLNAQIDNLSGRITTVKDKTDAQVAAVNQAVTRLTSSETAASEAFQGIPARVEALFEGRDMEITSRIATAVQDLQEQQGLRLKGRTDEAVTVIGESIQLSEDRLKLSRTRVDNLDTRLRELERAAATLEQRRLEDEVKYGAVAKFAEAVGNVETRLAAFDGRLRDINNKIAPVDQLIAELSVRAGPVAQLVSEAMAATSEEIAEQLWFVVKTNYVIFGLVIAAIFFLIWLVILTFLSLRRRHSPGLPQKGQHGAAK